MSTFEEQRQHNIKQNKALLADLSHAAQSLKPIDPQPPAKKRKVNRTQKLPATRSSARIANIPEPTYNEDTLDVVSSRAARSSNKPRTSATAPAAATVAAKTTPNLDVEKTVAGWTAWEPVAKPPTRDESGTFHFESHPNFLPNKSPEEMLREGCHGGSYFRPLQSKVLGITVSDDWKDIPSEWRDGLPVSYYLNSDYDPEINKYGVKCGQSIEEWEAAGWIAHEYDIRGWFQWYMRFYSGRRCADDERQVSRWSKCVGERGRWRRMLLKKYVQMGVRSVSDEGEESEYTNGEVSPVVHQTCHHWAWEIRQDVLDAFWKTEL
ncbi:hypothetical protein PVAG01_10780 [Phlyctema vagabunda]|uniref:Vegetatible incompatibility protein HET-E-1 n=1 Tax=Phlyctema vagabunda TaxID=108571 RepID=A0ABR4P376_9HELO